MQEKKLAGIWIDNNKAVVVKNHDAQNAFKFFICSPLKLEVQRGNSSENAGNNAEKTNKQKFFKEIEKLIINTQELYITGPGTIQEELKKYLAETPQFKNLPITLGTDSQLSDEEVLEKVKKHFGV